MFDLGWTEIALTGAVAVVILGPEDMPGALRSLGKFVRKIRTFTADMQQSLDRIVNEAEVDGLAHTLNREIGGTGVDFEAERQLAEEERRLAYAQEGYTDGSPPENDAQEKEKASNA